jgi:succinoglycan biosynthesis protein ExoO
VRHPSISASRLPFLERCAVRAAAPSGPVDQHGAAVPHPAATPTSKGQVLFISRQRIVGRTNGSSAYLLDLAGAVRRAGFTPHLLQPAPDLMGRWPVMRLRPEMNTFETHEIRGVLRLGAWVLARDPRVALDALRAVLSRLARRSGLSGAWLADRPRAYAIAAPWTATDRAFIARRAAGRADIMIADYAFQAEALRPDRPSAIVMHDLFHLREAPAGGRDSVVRLDRDREIALLARADAVIAIQAAEALFLVDHLPSVRPILAPMAARPHPRAQPGDGGRLLFVGSNTAPNVVGLQWFFDHVWPLLREAAAAIRLDVAGSVSAAFPGRAPPGVVFHGMVDDLDPLYAQAGIVISPLTFGSGLKIKLVEALAQGKAVVATGVTLQGVETECADAVMHADEPRAFADAILSLAEHAMRHALAEAALAAARAHFSPQACHAAFTAWLDEHRPRGGAAA